MANIRKDKTAAVASKLLRSLYGRDDLIDWAVHFKSYRGVLRRRTIFSGLPGVGRTPTPACLSLIAACEQHDLS